jgi:5-methylcytosine-specific restriction endonuclease McrA
MNTGSPADYEELIDKLLSCLGISKSSFQEAVAWSLCEHMVAFLAEDREEIMAIRNDRDFFAKFGLYLKKKTGRKWSFADAESIRKRLMMSFEEHHTRQPIHYDHWLRLLFTTPLRCAKCGAAPPDVTLEIDHFFPSARGGDSTAPNLRFLCMKENREKSANLEATTPWLRLK